MFGNSLFLTLSMLSVVRLAISICPFRFQAANHTLLSILLLLIILGIPLAEILLRSCFSPINIAS
jgi:hypothetical protein